MATQKKLLAVVLPLSFRRKLEEAEKLLDFSSVYLVPGRAPVEPRDVDLSTRFSRSVPLNIPIVSSPMDTVTGYEMAVAMALLGGIGVIHRNMSREEQVSTAKRVKEHPVFPLRRLYVEKSYPCSTSLEIMASSNTRVLPVVEDSSLEGYVWAWRLKEICREGVEPTLLAIDRAGPRYTPRSYRDAVREVLRGSYDAVAITASDSVYLGTILVQDVLSDYSPATSTDGSLVVAAAVSPYDIDRAILLDKHVDALVGDIAHFHSTPAIEAAKKLVKNISSDFVAGNIGTYQAVVDLASSLEKLDGLRVGIAGGSICTTADVGGVYAPTLWAVASTRDAVEDYGLNIPIIADGGIRSSGDAVKALSVGASTVMLGYLLAGTDEALGDLVVLGDKLYKPYRGMASRSALARRYAVDRYSRVSKRVPEGIEGLVEYKGSVYSRLREFIEGIKAGLGYAGARNIKELWEKGKLGLAHRKSLDRVLTSQPA